MNPITEYTLGFAMDELLEQVVLIRKNRPTWQSGLLNGVGGHVEEGEIPEDTMIREFKEETGVQSEKHDWKKLCILVGENFKVVVFFTTNVNINAIESMTDEHVDRYMVSDIVNGNSQTTGCISNLPWMLNLIRDKDFLAGKIHPPVIGYVSI